MPHVVHVDNTAAFFSRMDRNYRYKYERLRQLDDFTCVDVFETWPTLNAWEIDLLIIGVFGCPLHPLFPHHAKLPMQLYDATDRICLVIEDMHDHTYGGGLRNLYAYINLHVNYVISIYDNPELTELKLHCPRLRGTYVLPHFIDTNIYKDYGLPKKWDILMYGNIDSEVYPFRSRLRELIRARLPRAHEMSHPGYSRYDAERCGEALAKTINQSLIAIATPSIYDCLVAKFFEISACHCVVAGKLATQGKPIWDDNFIHLDEQMSDEKILKVLCDALANPKQLADKAEVMYQLTQRNASIEQFANAMCQIVEDITRA